MNAMQGGMIIISEKRSKPGSKGDGNPTTGQVYHRPIRKNDKDLIRDKPRRKNHSKETSKTPRVCTNIRKATSFPLFDALGWY